MKYSQKLPACLLSGLLLFVATVASGQINTLKGTWINADMQSIVIHDTSDKQRHGYLGTKTQPKSLQFQVRLDGDTLRFESRYTSSRTDYKKLYVDQYDLKIIHSDSCTLALKPVSTFATDIFGSDEPILVKRQECTTDSTIRLEKLVFSSGLCHGTCPKYEYELTNKGTLRLHVIEAFEKNSFMTDLTAQGYFVGQVPDSLYRRVIDALQTCYLRQLVIEPILCVMLP